MAQAETEKKKGGIRIDTIFVSRHPGAIAWIQKHHPEFGEAKVIGHATPGDIKGNRIIGVLPVDLASLAGEYWHLTMRLPPEARGKELSLEEMEQYGCSIERYEIVHFPRGGKVWQCEACGARTPMI